jgi:tetratricopeptide (TPR) repeat protein
MNYFFKAASAFLALFCILTVSAQDDIRPAATWQVQKYDISAILPQSESDRSLVAKAKLDLKNVSARPASTVTLRIGVPAEVGAVGVGGSAVDFTKAEEKINSALSLQRLVLRLPAVQPGGSVSVTVDYKYTVKENTGLNSLTATSAQFLPTSFWYPTPNSWFFARGADFAATKIQVQAHGQTVVASGSETAGTFDQRLYVQPFFLAGAWETINSGAVTVYLPKGAGAEEQKRGAELAALTAEARVFVAGLLGTAPDVPLRIVAVRRGGGYSGGGTILVDDAALRRSKLDSQTVMNIADAIAKMWLGNAAAVADDGFGVIREGLARHIANQFLESKYGREVAEVERLRQLAAYASIARRDAPLAQVSPLDDYYYPAVANKGAMIWRLLARNVGQEQLFSGIRTHLQDGKFTLAEFRAANPANKELLDNALDQVTDMTLMAGLPAGAPGEWKVALRNTGAVDATVNVSALLANGEKMSAPVTVKARSFGEIVFRTPHQIKRVEIDPEKLYPQSDYSDDVAPRETTDSDLLLAVKRPFDKQDFALAETTARMVLRDHPRFDDVRILLARSLLSQNKTSESDKEFRSVLDEQLPTARSLAWASVGLAEIAARAGQSEQAIKFAEDAIRADGEYGASLAARAVRNRANAPVTNDESIKGFFAQFDKAAAANRKADLEALAVSGDVSRFTAGIAGQTVEWKTTVLHVDKMDANTAWVETRLAIKLLNKQPESGTAVYRLTRSGAGWKLSGVDIFEVR